MIPSRRHKRLLAAACAALLAGTAGSAAATQLHGAQYQKMAKITLQQARATALKAMPGKIVAEELEKEPGGSGLRYSFDIKAGGQTHEVGVDAEDGKILENGVESKSDEARESD